MAEIRVTVSVETDHLDVQSLVQDHLDRHLRFKTVGASCRKCRAMEERSEAGLEFDAPPLHPHCDCILVLDEENDR